MPDDKADCSPPSISFPRLLVSTGSRATSCRSAKILPQATFSPLTFLHALRTYTSKSSPCLALVTLHTRVRSVPIQLHWFARLAAPSGIAQLGVRKQTGLFMNMSASSSAGTPSGHHQITREPLYLRSDAAHRGWYGSRTDQEPSGMCTTRLRPSYSPMVVKDARGFDLRSSTTTSA